MLVDARAALLFDEVLRERFQEGELVLRRGRLAGVGRLAPLGDELFELELPAALLRVAVRLRYRVNDASRTEVLDLTTERFELVKREPLREL